MMKNIALFLAPFALILFLAECADHIKQKHKPNQSSSPSLSSSSTYQQLHLLSQQDANKSSNHQPSSESSSSSIDVPTPEAWLGLGVTAYFVNKFRNQKKGVHHDN